ncbi:hypothetical protein E2C01_054007 [Portunus trituberculatus]|uniref:Uncharacterized protein n=1 Tax=Portunus trituberculatus TaxID=210409 RepID=A0A5B7GTT0_PORTR|nr:hypothetical protein [Portunus trituberculatus]
MSSKACESVRERTVVVVVVAAMHWAALCTSPLAPRHEMQAGHSPAAVRVNAIAQPSRALHSYTIYPEDEATQRDGKGRHQCLATSCNFLVASFTDHLSSYSPLSVPRLRVI